jgi:flavorubredoxin
MGRFLADAPASVLVGSDWSAARNIAHWDYAGAVRGMRDGDVLELGRHRLRFLETPHVHHWDSMMVLEETTGSLFPADLFIQPGDQPAVINEDLSPAMLDPIWMTPSLGRGSRRDAPQLQVAPVARPCNSAVLAREA